MRISLAALLIGAVGLTSCGGEPACAPAPLPDCSDVDAPAFAALHAELIAPSCAAGITCHVAGDTISDLDLSDPSTTRAILIGGGYVVPGSPECSEVTQRMTSTDRFFRMPPSGTLSVEQQCAVIAWVRDGAP